MSESPDKIPTIGPAAATGGKAEHIFEGAFPRPDWLTRKQSPDVFVDYFVEVVEKGEPTGRQFAAQVKGTQSRKGVAAPLKFSAKAKQVRYWLNDCLHPVFIFLIDVEKGTGHWLFLQKHVREQITKSALQKQTKITLRFSPDDSLQDMERFKATLVNAEKYVRDMHPGSVKSAILAEEERLKALYPGAAVSIAATNKHVKYHISQAASNSGGMKLKFLNSDKAAAVKSFLETGQSFEVKATEIQTDDSPALTKLLQELGDATIKIQTAHKAKGCVQFTLMSSAASSPVMQIEGEWSLAPKRAVFKGQLSDAPLLIEYVRAFGKDETDQHCEIKFRFDFNAWQGQPLQALAYFSELRQLVHCSVFTTRCLIRGNQIWPPETLTVAEDGRAQLVEALEWLHKSIQTAKVLPVNPPFPPADSINPDGAESKNTQLMIKLIEAGIHEQNNNGEEVVMSSEGPSGESAFPVGKRELTVNWTETFRLINFFGIEIPFGPLIHTWTDLELVATRPLSDVRTEMTFKGGANSIWRIEYHRPDAGQPAPLSSS